MRDTVKPDDIVRHRQKFDMTRPEYAEAIGLPPETLKSYETGKRSIPDIVGTAMRVLDYEKTPT